MFICLYAYAARLILGLDRRAHITLALKNSTVCLFNTEYNSKLQFLCTSVFNAVVHSTSSI